MKTTVDSRGPRTSGPNPQSPDTFFAPAARTDMERFRNQIETIGHSPLMSTLLKSIGGLLVVLNEDRQIVALNDAFLHELGVRDSMETLGLRLGESLRCIHADEPPNGCGTTPHCRTCGAVIAMMAALTEDRAEEQVCALTVKKGGAVLNTSLKVRAQPLVVDGERLIMIFARDITQQQFWAGLEHVFFHDVNNILAAILGNTELLHMKMPDREEVQQLRFAVARLCNEVAIQRELSYRKDALRLTTRKDVSLRDIQREVDGALSGHPASRDKTIVSDWPHEDVLIYTDSMLVARVLFNMLLNALEATPAGGTISLRATVGPDHVVWETWNAGHIPSHVRDRIFQRHYSTKAKTGRGLGTYSMKLFGEQYLKGEVTFNSEPESGTTFTFRLPRLRETPPH